MPIRRRNRDWYWGSRGPFRTKRKAEQVARAAYSSGYKTMAMKPKKKKSKKRSR